MEILKLVQDMQTEEYRYNRRRENLRRLCGYYLNDYQLDVLIAETASNSQTMYAAQPRQSGTSTALLLKVYQSIFLNQTHNTKLIISRTNNQCRYMKEAMIELLNRSDLMGQVVRHNRYSIEFNFGTIIYFYNNNSQNLLGFRMNPEVFFDDYNTNDSTNDEMLNVVTSTFPTHVHFFLAGIETYNIMYN